MLHRLRTALLALTLIGLMFAFIFTALGGWSASQDTFGSVTQTVLVSGTGKIVLLLRARAEGELDSAESGDSEISRFLSAADDDDDLMVSAVTDGPVDEEAAAAVDGEAATDV